MIDNDETILYIYNGTFSFQDSFDCRLNNFFSGEVIIMTILNVRSLYYETPGILVLYKDFKVVDTNQQKFRRIIDYTRKKLLILSY